MTVASILIRGVVLGRMLTFFMLAGAVSFAATEYHLAVDGDDANDGLTAGAAFATFQHALDALAAGDTLTIGPGEYHQAARREGLGDGSVWTTIRAAIPGTVLFRGDVPAPDFQAVEGMERVYYAVYDEPVQCILEWDTYTPLLASPNAAQLEITPGAWFQDPESGTLYLSTSDYHSPEGRRYSLAVIAESGLHLIEPEQVRIEGLAFAGFNIQHERSDRQQRGAAWGIWLENPVRCIVEDCVAFLNTAGIGLTSRDSEGGTIIRNSKVYGNRASFAGSAGNLAGIAVYHSNDDAIINCIGREGNSTAFRFYQGGKGSGLIKDSIAAEGAMQMKGGSELREQGVISHSIANGVARSYINRHSIVGGGNRHRQVAELTGTIHLRDFDDLDLNAEFADPANLDFRLQATSRFRGAADDSSDMGPVPFAATVFFVAPDGNDANNGLSACQPWQSLDAAVARLKAGDTLYLLAGEYTIDRPIRVKATAEAPVAIRGRGLDIIRIKSPVDISHSSHLSLERLVFEQPVTVHDSTRISIRNSVFHTASTAITLSGVTAARLTHNQFHCPDHTAIAMQQCNTAFLAGNLFATGSAAAISSDDAESILYSDYNAYSKPQWLVAGEIVAPAERYSTAIGTTSEQKVAKDSISLDHALLSAGPLGRAIGPHRFERSIAPIATEPRLHSVSATTANLEWLTNNAASFTVEWGSEPDLSDAQQERVTIKRFGTYSISGLAPATTYYFRLVSASTIHGRTSGIESEPVTLTCNNRVVAFTTLAKDPPPQTYHVAPDGDDSNDGLSASAPLRTINHAANLVRPGDTVVVAPGTYPEQVRLRATGTADRPIRFTGSSEGRTVVSGGNKELRTLFAVLNKSFIDIDLFHFEQMNYSGIAWPAVRGAGGTIVAINSDHLTISRCLYDGRHGYSPPFVAANNCRDLTIRNCVILSPMGSGLQITGGDRFLFEHNVLLRPLIGGMWIELRGEVTLRNNIFSDNRPSKAFFPLVRFNRGQFIEDNNAFSLRSDEREPIGIVHAEPFVPDDKPEGWQPRPWLHDSADFSIFEVLNMDLEAFLQARPDGPVRLPEDAIMLRIHLNRELSFEHFIPRNPTFLERTIGLQPEAFPWLQF